MAKNTGEGSRKGSLINRTQTYNSKTKLFIKRDETGKFIQAKESPFKNVRKEENAKIKN